jgi:hypothetical protein
MLCLLTAKTRPSAITAVIPDPARAQRMEPGLGGVPAPDRLPHQISAVAKRPRGPGPAPAALLTTTTTQASGSGTPNGNRTSGTARASGWCTPPRHPTQSTYPIVRTATTANRVDTIAT